ncbi:MAG: DUF4105 domain-containing protein [Bacteroidales bacterium]|nr:DUF4105 domain-containing protein [Bacteroidales bacterium]
MKFLKHIPLILIFFFISKINIGQILSPNAEISVITCAPGNELYSTFGHSAIRINDPVHGIDKVYNYGTFNFETPGFYMKFIRGKLDYMLSVERYRYFVMSYIQEKRAIKEQILNLSFTQKSAIYKALEINAMPENMYYRYDFLKDNCSTRVLKIINNAIQDSLNLPGKLSESKKTYREMLMPYLENKNWERFGINLALGLPVDNTVSIEESAFLPDYLYKIFENSEIKTSEGTEPLVKQENNLYLPKGKKIIKISPYSPSRISWMLLILVLLLTIYEIRYRKYYLLLDKTLFFIFGFIGLNILFLWFGTDHSSVINNRNIIWASPLYFIAAFLLKSENKKYLRIFLFLYSIIIVFGLITDLFITPLFDKAVLPLELILIVRTSLIYIRK